MPAAGGRGKYLIADGLPMADSDVQALYDAGRPLRAGLLLSMACWATPNVHSAMDTMAPYERYNYGKHPAPDVMAVLGVGSQPGLVPDVGGGRAGPRLSGRRCCRGNRI